MPNLLPNHSSVHRSIENGTWFEKNSLRKSSLLQVFIFSLSLHALIHNLALKLRCNYYWSKWYCWIVNKSSFCKMFGWMKYCQWSNYHQKTGQALWQIPHSIILSLYCNSIVAVLHNVYLLQYCNKYLFCSTVSIN